MLENVEEGAFLNYLHYLNACAYKTQFCSALPKNPNLVYWDNVFLGVPISKWIPHIDFIR